MHLLALYLHLIGASLRSQMQYRVSFLLDTLALFGVTFLDFFSIALLFRRFEGLRDWTLWEVGFLYSLINLAFALAEMVGRGFDAFHRDIVRGGFDKVLFRPLSPFYQILGSQFQLRRIGRIIQALIIFGIAHAHLGIAWTPSKAAFLVLSLLGGTCFFLGLMVFGATFCFWTVQSIEILNIFTHGGVEAGNYPMSIYRGWFRRFFTYIVPLAFVSYFPSLHLMDKPDPLGLSPLFQFIAPLIGPAFLGLSLIFWRIGVGHYQSTGT